MTKKIRFLVDNQDTKNIIYPKTNTKAVIDLAANKNLADYRLEQANTRKNQEADFENTKVAQEASLQKTEQKFNAYGEDYFTTIPQQLSEIEAPIPEIKNRYTTGIPNIQEQNKTLQGNIATNLQELINKETSIEQDSTNAAAGYEKLAQAMKNTCQTHFEEAAARNSQLLLNNQENDARNRKTLVELENIRKGLMEQDFDPNWGKLANGEVQISDNPRLKQEIQEAFDNKYEEEFQRDIADEIEVIPGTTDKVKGVQAKLQAVVDNDLDRMQKQAARAEAIKVDLDKDIDLETTGNNLKNLTNTITNFTFENEAPLSIEEVSDAFKKGVTANE